MDRTPRISILWIEDAKNAGYSWADSALEQGDFWRGYVQWNSLVSALRSCMPDFSKTREGEEFWEEVIFQIINEPTQ